MREESRREEQAREEEERLQNRYGRTQNGQKYFNNKQTNICMF